MSLLARYECPVCLGHTGYAGDRARQSKLRKHLACTCPTDAELDAQLTETVSDPLPHLEPRKAA